MNIPTDAIVMTIALVAGFIFFKMKKKINETPLAIYKLPISFIANFQFL